MDINTVLFILVLWMILGIILIYLSKRIIIYDKDTKEILAIINPLFYSKQITKTNMNIILMNKNDKIITENNETGKIYLKEDK